MASNQKKDAEWAEAKKKCRLNDETLKMAREMGLAILKAKSNKYVMELS